MGSVVGLAVVVVETGGFVGEGALVVVGDAVAVGDVSGDVVGSLVTVAVGLVVAPGETLVVGSVVATGAALSRVTTQFGFPGESPAYPLTCKLSTGWELLFTSTTESKSWL